MRIKGVSPGRFSAPAEDINAGMQRIVQSRVNGGMITTIDSADIDPAAFQLAKNVTVRFDKTKRRPGSILLTPPKPNSNAVTKLAFIKQKDGNPHTLRMTPSTIHIRGDLQWYPIVITPALTGGINDRFNTADVLDKFVFTNNGSDPIQTINFDTNTCAPLGNAYSVYAANPRFVFGFFNRVVGLALKDKAETTAIWSADGVPTEFDPTVDNSAGSSPILESPNDLSDFIKGGLSFTNIAIIFREKSIWHATKQPIAQNPFYFYSAIPGIGCNLPFTIEIGDLGSAIWADQRTRAVWAYIPGQVPERIFAAIEKTIFKLIEDPNSVFAAYDALEHEYTLYIPNNGIVTGFTYNFLTKACSQQEYLDVVSANDTELTTAGRTIDELPGTIDELPGTIDSLSEQDSELAARSYGRSDGDIAIEDETSNLDAASEAFTSDLQSKSFVLPELDLNVCKILIEYQCTRTSHMLLQYTKNNGLTWITVKTIIATVFNRPRLLLLQRLILARRFTWRLQIMDGDPEILSYEIYVTPSGDSNK